MFTPTEGSDAGATGSPPARAREGVIKFLVLLMAVLIGAGSASYAISRTPLGAMPEHSEVQVEEGRLRYACPMPEHAGVVYDQPGKCPLCGMDLVPVHRKAGHVDKPAAYWTCPMPEHASVHEPGPGKCPICGMSLIPVPAKSPEQAPAKSPEQAPAQPPEQAPAQSPAGSRPSDPAKEGSHVHPH